MKKIFGASVSLLIGGLIVFSCFNYFEQEALKREADNGQEAVHYAVYGKKEFYGDLEGFKKSALNLSGKTGGVLSHHFLMASEIAKFFASLGQQKIDTLVIIGPNHYGVGQNDILVSALSFLTPWGKIEPDKEVIRSLVGDRIVEVDERPFEGEHSISTLAGFIKYYLPETKIVPIILKRNTAKERAQELATSLAESLPVDNFVLVSADFSHHVDLATARTQDQESIEAIKNFELEKLFKFNEFELDSPISVYALLSYLKIKGQTKMQYINLNSAEFSGNLDSKDVTSYIFARF